MADTLNLRARLELTANLTHTVTNDDETVVGDPVVKTADCTFENGIEAWQVDKVFHERRTLDPAASKSYTLASPQTARLGESVTFASVKAIIVWSRAATNALLTLNGGAAPLLGWASGLTAAVNIKPGGLFVLTSPNTGFPCAPGADELVVTNGGEAGSSTYDIIILGTSA